MCNDMSSVKDLTEAYNGFKEVVMKEASWDALKEMSPFEFQIGISCMKLADASMKVIAEQDELLHEMSNKLDRLGELLKKIDSKTERLE